MISRKTAYDCLHSKIFFVFFFRLRSAIKQDIMPYTNYTYEFKGMIDYIFYPRYAIILCSILLNFTQFYSILNNYTQFYSNLLNFSQTMKPTGFLGPVDSQWLKENKVVGCPHPQVPSGKYFYHFWITHPTR